MRTSEIEAVGEAGIAVVAMLARLAAAVFRLDVGDGNDDEEEVATEVRTGGSRPIGVAEGTEGAKARLVRVEAGAEMLSEVGVVGACPAVGGADMEAGAEAAEVGGEAADRVGEEGEPIAVEGSDL